MLCPREECQIEMKFIYCYDDAQVTDHAYNLYACTKCGTLFKDSIWEDACKIYIFPDGSILSSKDTKYI